MQGTEFIIETDWHVSKIILQTRTNGLGVYALNPDTHMTEEVRTFRREMWGFYSLKLAAVAPT